MTESTKEAKISINSSSRFQFFQMLDKGRVLFKVTSSIKGVTLKKRPVSHILQQF